MKSLNQVISLGVLAFTVSWLVSCRPGPMDPPMDFNYQRQVIEPSNWTDVTATNFDHIGAQQLWASTSESSKDADVVIAMVGTGIDYTNPDLRNGLWLNTGELGDHARKDRVDNDRNGYADDVFGFDFYSGDALPFDWHGHDSFTASVVAAPGIKNSSVLGVAPNAQLMVLRYLGPDGQGAALDAIMAMDYAAANGANVIYFNWPNGGFGAEDASVINAIQKLKAKNILVIVPAGNTANQNIPHLIASGELQKMEHVLVVGAEDSQRNLQPASNRGVNLVSLSALSSGWNGYFAGQDISQGLDNTAVAAAVVAGAAARLRTLPGQGSVASIRALLLRSVSKEKTQANLAQGGLYFQEN